MKTKPSRAERNKVLWCVAVAVAVISVGKAVGGAEDRLPDKTALDQYVAKPDDSFSWKIVKRGRQPGGRTVVLDMVSQAWRTREDVNRTQWQHWVTVAIPDKVRSDIGFLYIGGGRNGGDPPDGPSDTVLRIAQATGSVVAELHMVPNQPLVFHHDGQPRVEDDLVAYTWDQFLKTGDPTWPARNPMVKSAVRAMDAISELLASDEGGRQTVNRFVVAGGSKRGWTTWLTGAVDDRVVAIVPIVIDVLNVQTSMLHHFAAYGFWAPAIGDYVEHKITQRMNDPRMSELCKLVDPYAYRHRLEKPKYIVCAAGDQFFLPDSSQFYFDGLAGEKYLRYVPNADHGLDGSDALESIAAFHWMIVRDKPRPRFSWSFDPDGSIRVEATDRPKQVLLWQATNPEARDFRIESLGPKYTSRPLKDKGNGRFQVHVPAPDKGWTAFFIELTYDVGAPAPIKFTTGVRVTPDVLPHADKDPTQPTTIALTCTAPDEAAAKAIASEARAAFRTARHADRALPWSRQGRQQSTAGPPATRPPSTNGSPANGRGSSNWGRVTRSGRSLELRWQPAGRLRDGALGMSEWLKQHGCDDFAYRLETGR